MRRAERASSSSAHQLFRAYHTSSRRRVQLPEPKSDTERVKLGLPLREPWFEVKPFDEKKMRFVLRLKDTLQAQPKLRMEVSNLSLLRRELDVLRDGKQRKMATYVRRFPAAFTLRSFFTPNNKKKTWCRFSADALKLLEEEDAIFQASEAFLLQKLRKILMISMKNRLPFATVEQVRQSLGLPVDFKESLVKKYPDFFQLKERKGFLYLELQNWDETLAISMLEKNTQEGKYTTRSKKKRRGKPIIEANEHISSIDAEYEQNCSSKGEEVDDENLTEKGEEHNQEFSAAMHEKHSEGKSERRVVVDESDECNEQSSHGNNQQDMLSIGHVKGEELRNVGAESYQQKVVAISSLGSDGDMQSSSVPPVPKPELSIVLDVDSDAHNDDLSVKVEHESPAIVVFMDKDGQHQAASDFVDGNTTCGEKQLESSKGMFEDLACLRFPWITKKGKQPDFKRVEEIESFQSLPYISPYKNSRELVLPPHKTPKTDKFLVGLIHEFLSLTPEKRATVQQLELFRRPYRLPIDLLGFLLKYDGIFYVAKGKTKSHVFLKEGYKEFHLLEKEPLVLWQERFVELAFKSPKPEVGKSRKGPSSQDAQSVSEEE